MHCDFFVAKKLHVPHASRTMWWNLQEFSDSSNNRRNKESVSSACSLPPSTTPVLTHLHTGLVWPVKIQPLKGKTRPYSSLLSCLPNDQGHLTGQLTVNWLLIVIQIAAKINVLTDGPWLQLNRSSASFHFTVCGVSLCVRYTVEVVCGMCWNFILCDCKRKYIPGIIWH